MADASLRFRGQGRSQEKNYDRGNEQCAWLKSLPRSASFPVARAYTTLISNRPISIY